MITVFRFVMFPEFSLSVALRVSIAVRAGHPTLGPRAPRAPPPRPPPVVGGSGSGPGLMLRGCRGCRGCRVGKMMKVKLEIMFGSLLGAQQAAAAARVGERHAQMRLAMRPLATPHPTLPGGAGAVSAPSARPALALEVLQAGP